MSQAIESPSTQARRPEIRVAVDRVGTPGAGIASPEPISCRRSTPSHDHCGREVRPGTIPTNCTTCRLRELCLPVGLSGEELDSLDEAVYARRKIKKGAQAFRAGEALHHLYAIRLGSFKTSLHTTDGREQVTGFHLPGEVMGLDAIGASRHRSDAVALEDSELCVVPYSSLTELAQRFPRIGNNFHRLMSREVASNQNIMLLLGRMSAEERLATFLLELSQRWKALGYSPREFSLRMSREDIGNYLGLKIETVSRMFGKLADRGLIDVRRSEVQILDAAGLEGMIGAAIA